MIDAKTRDFIVGLLVIAAVGAVLAAIVRTGRFRSGDRFPIYMKTEIAQALNRDTRVFLQGLEVGRLRQINPVADTITSALSFVVLLEINETFPDGTPLTLPVGTEGLIAQPTPIAAHEIQLQIPTEGQVNRQLAPGDTIESVRQVSAVELLGEVAEQMKVELLATFGEVRELIRTSNRVAEDANNVLAETAPRVHSLLDQVGETLDRTEGILTDVQPRVGIFQDSILAALSDTRQLIRRMDSLGVIANTMAAENRVVVSEVMEHVVRTAEILSHFADQLSRRPLRMLSGVTPPRDTTDTDR